MTGNASTQPDQQAEHYQHIGAYLRDIREHYGLSVDDAARRLHIRHKYITAIEQGDVSGMPGKVYTLGYIQSYAEFLGLNADEVIAQYHELQQFDSERVFKVIEPTQQRSLPNHKLMVFGIGSLLIAGLLWVLFSTVEPTERDIVEPVPDDLLQQTERVLVLNETNKQCLSMQPQPAFPACFYGAPIVPNTAFLLQPVNHVMELY